MDLSNIASTITDPGFLAAVFAAVACFATVMTFALPAFQGDKLDQAESAAAGCLLVPSEAAPLDGRTVIRVDRPRNAFAKALQALHPPERPAEGVHSAAVVAVNEQQVSVIIRETFKHHGLQNIYSFPSKMREEDKVYLNEAVARFLRDEDVDDDEDDEEENVIVEDELDTGWSENE